MFGKFLGIGEDLEVLRASVARSAGKPAFVVGRMAEVHGCRFRLPGEQVYRSVSKLEFYLSCWTTGDCLGFFDPEGNPVEDPPRPLDGSVLRYFDVVPASWVQIAYPLRAGEPSPTTRNPHLEAHGLQAGLGSTQFVDVSPEDVPVELKEYVQTVRNRRYPGDQKTCTGIFFAVSEHIENPREERASWHIGVDYRTREGAVASLQPPGWYSGAPISCLLSMNPFGLVDAEPGICIVCHGRSGRRKHVGANRGLDVPLGCVCEACLPSFFEQARALLLTWEPPPKTEAT